MRLSLLVAVAFLATPAAAAEIRIAIPALAGDYQLISFDLPQHSTLPPSTRLAQIETGIPISQVVGFSIELTGTIASGVAVGDGFFRESRTIPLRGAFAPYLSLGDFHISQLAVSAENDGPLYQLLEFPGSLSYPHGPDVAVFDPIITLALAPTTYSFTDVNYIDVPTYPIALPDTRGINVIEPMVGQIASASIVISFVPEPATAMLALPTLAVVASLRRSLAAFRPARRQRV